MIGRSVGGTVISGTVVSIRVVVRVFGTGVGGVVIGAGIVVRVVAVISVGLVELVKVIAVAVGEVKSTLGVGATGKSMYAVLHFSGHGELGPVSAVKPLAGHEAVEIVPTLMIAG
jgi:hypothetical protein